MKKNQLGNKQVLHVVVSKHGKFGGGENIVDIYSSAFPNNTHVITNSLELSKRIGVESAVYVNISSLNIFNLVRLVYAILISLRKHEFVCIVSHHRYGTYASYIAKTIIRSKVQITHYIHYYTNRVSLIPFFISNFISVSKCLRDHWVSFHKAKGNNVYVLSNGTDLAQVDSAEILNFCLENRIVRNDLNLCIVGRLDPIKGHLVLFDAILHLKEKLSRPVTLYVIGDGGIRQELETYVRDHSLDNNIKFLGFVKGPQKYLTIFDVLVQPSFSEGLPFTLIEGMASRIKIVASNISPNKEALGEDYKFLAQVGDHIDLSDKIYEMINLSREESENIIENLYELYTEKFTMDKMLNSYSTYINLVQ